VHLNDGSPSDNRRFQRHNILASAMLYDAMAYGHLEAEVSVAHDSPVVDGSSCSILHAGIPSKHYRVHDRDHKSRSVHVSEDDYSVWSVLVKVEPAPDDSEMLLGLGLIDRHDLPNSCVHSWASILCLPSCLDVVELRYTLTLLCQAPGSICRRLSFQCRRGGIGLE